MTAEKTKSEGHIGLKKFYNLLKIKENMAFDGVLKEK